MSPQNNGIVIKIPIPDWDEEYMQTEPQLADEDDIITLLQQKGYSPQKVARLTLVARERGNAPDTILPPNKLLLNSGAAVDISAKVAARKLKVELPNGRQINVREFVAPVPLEQEPGEAEDDHRPDDTQTGHVSPLPLPRPPDEALVQVLSQAAAGWAADYLLKRVPGYIRGRLNIIAANQGDVAEVAGELKAIIDEMVLELG